MSAFEPSDLSSPFLRPRYGFEGVLPQTGFSPLIDMFFQMGLPQLANTMLPGTDMRLLGVQGSLQQRMTDLRRTKLHDAFMASQRVAPAVPYRDMLLGISSAFGVERTQEVVDAASDLGSIIQGAEPMLVSQMPGFFDQIAGSRGSEAVFREYMFRTSMMRRDPRTGATDLRSVDSLSNMTDPLFERMFSGENYLKADGLTAGQAGQFAAAAQARGLMPGLSARDIQEALGDPAKADDLQNLDVTKIEDTLRKYAKTLTAIREVFSDAGRPDAPMSELIAQMQAMAGQSLGAVADPTNLAKQIRTNYKLAQRAGLSFDGMQQVQEAARQQSEAVGLGPMSDLYLAQFSLSNRVALQTTGLLDRGMTNMTAEQLLMREQTDLVSAADSNLLAYAEILKEDIASGLIDANDPKVKQFQAALADPTGQTAGPNGRPIFRMQDADFLDLYENHEMRNSARLRLTNAANEYSRRDAANGFITSRQVLTQQYNEYVESMSDLVSPGLAGLLSKETTQGLAPGQAAAGLKKAVSDYLNVMSTEAYGKASRSERDVLRRSAITNALQDSGMSATDEEVAKLYNSISLVTTSQSRLRYDGRKPEDLAAQQQLRNSAESQAILREEQQNADMSALLTESFGEKTPLRRLSDSLAAAGSKSEMERDPKLLQNLILEQLGAVGNEPLRKAFDVAIVDLTIRRKALEEARGKTISEQEYKDQLLTLGVTANRLAQLGEGLGIGDKGIKEHRDNLRVALQQQSHYDAVEQGLSPEAKTEQDKKASSKRLEALNSLLADPNYAARFGQEKFNETKARAEAERGFDNADASTRQKIENESVAFLKQLYDLSDTQSQFSYLGEDKGKLDEIASKAFSKQRFAYSSVEQLLGASSATLDQLEKDDIISAADKSTILSAQKKRQEAIQLQNEYQRSQTPGSRLELAAEAIYGKDLSQGELNQKLAGLSESLSDADALAELEKVAQQTAEYRKILASDTGGYEKAEEYRRTKGLASGFVRPAIDDANATGKLKVDQAVDYGENIEKALRDLLEKVDSKEKPDTVKLSMTVGELVVKPDGSARMITDADMTAAARTA